MAKLTLKQIRQELEKKTTLDDKKKFLEDLLKKIKGKKLREKVEKLLAETQEQVKHEERFEGEKLEKKLTTIPAAEEQPRTAFAEIRKYVPRAARDTGVHTSGLEREVRAAAPARVTEFGPPKYIALASGDYINFAQAQQQARLLLEARGLMKRMSAEQFYAMSPTQKQALFSTVGEALGEGVKNYYQLNTLVKSIAVGPEERQKSDTDTLYKIK